MIRLLTAVGLGVALMTGAAAAQDKAMIEKGEKLYTAQKCQMCHAVNGKGNAKGPLDGVGDKLKQEEIRQWLINPAEMTAKSKAARKPPMKAYANLAKDDIEALVAYMQSLKKK